MSVTVESLQEYIDKDVTLHLIQSDGSLKELEGKIMAATIAGVPFKAKGKSGVELLFVNQIEEVSAAAVKPKTVSQKKLRPIIAGQMRQHLADRHGIELAWCRSNTKEAAVEFHNSLDHSKLGHKHVEPKSDEPAEASSSDE